MSDSNPLQLPVIPPKQLSVKECKTRLILYKGWQQKTDPFQVAKKINKFMGKDLFISSIQVRYWYKRFNKGDTDILPNEFKIRCPAYFSGQQKPKIAMDSLLLLDEEYYHIKDGRFCMSTFKDSGQFYITVYDLFQGTQKKTPVIFDTSDMELRIAGKYMIFFETRNSKDFYTRRIHTFKVSYKNLSVKHLETIIMSPPFYLSEFVVDQLDNEHFIIGNCNELIDCQIEDDKLYLESQKCFYIGYLFELRLRGNKLYGFDEIFSPTSLELCEYNLETKEMNRVNAPLINAKEGDEFICQGRSCWIKDRFYGFYMGEGTNKYHLLTFDAKTLKWSCLEIWSNALTNVLVDENEIMTIYGYYNESLVFYRLALRKPDKLMNLSRWAAVRESNLYGNEKYVEAARKIPIKM